MLHSKGKRYWQQLLRRWLHTSQLVHRTQEPAAASKDMYVVSELAAASQVDTAAEDRTESSGQRLLRPIPASSCNLLNVGVNISASFS